MTTSYNLVDCEWIPCVELDGRIVYNGLLESLARASQYKEIRDESPLVTVSLHRLLLAILHRVFGPETPHAWVRLWQEGHGKFDLSMLAAYLKSPKIFPRFDLFNSKHPFYQTADLPLGDPDKKNMGRPKFVKPIWQMAHELADSDSMNVFAQFKQTDWQTRPPGEAARWLVAFQAFALGGLITTEEGKKAQDGSADAGQMVKSAIVLGKGDNLFQTLMLNLVHYSAEEGTPFSFKANKDKAAWERDDPVRPADRTYEGYLDLLTWQSRRVKLIPEMSPDAKLLGVSGVVTMKGWQLPGFDRFGRETMVGFVKPEKVQKGQDPWPPLGFRSGKELWRDSHALLQSVAEKTERPKILSWVGDLREEGHLNRAQIQLDIFGLSADRAKIFFWRHESLPVPLAYLENANLLGKLKEAIKLAEEVASEALRWAVRAAIANRLSNDSGMNADKDRVSNLVKSFSPERLFWSRLELPYHELIVNLAEAASAEDRTALIQPWFFETLRPTALHAFEETIGRLDSARDLKAVTTGRGMLHGLLKKVQNANHVPDLEPKEGAA